MSEAAIKPHTQDIVVDEVFATSPESIWRALTTGALIVRWLKMTPDGFQAVKGARFTFQTTAAGAWDGVIQCQVLEATANERLSYSWRSGHEGNRGYGSRLDTVVTWILSPAGTGTRLQLIHSGFVTPKNDSALKSMGEAWPKVVQAIGVVAESRH